jgi:hypothetical protein
MRGNAVVDEIIVHRATKEPFMAIKWYIKKHAIDW